MPAGSFGHSRVRRHCPSGRRSAPARSGRCPARSTAHARLTCRVRLVHRRTLRRRAQRSAFSGMEARVRSWLARLRASAAAGVLVCAQLAAAAPATGAAAGHARPSSRIASLAPTPAANKPRVAFTDDHDQIMQARVDGGSPPVKPENLAFTGPNAADGSQTPHEGEVSDNGHFFQAFVSTRGKPSGDAGDVYVVPLSSTTAVRITCDNATKTHPVVSPDNRQVAYAATNAAGHFDIVVASITATPCDGTPATPLPGQSGDNLWPAWTSDSTSIVYSSTRDNPLGDLYLTPTTSGSTTVRLTDGAQANGKGVANTQPAVALFGAGGYGGIRFKMDFILFTTTMYRADGSLAYMLLPAGATTPPAATTFPSVWPRGRPPQSSEAAWATTLTVGPPDSYSFGSDAIAFTTTENDPYGKVRTVAFDGYETGNQTLVLKPFAASQPTPAVQGVAESHGAWYSPACESACLNDPTQLLVTTRSITADVSDVLATDGSGRRRLAHATSADGKALLDSSAPAYTPDGTRIAFSQAGAIMTGAADGTNTATKLPDGRGLVDYDTQPSWSPDGTKIAFVRAQYGKTVRGSPLLKSIRVWVADLASGTAHPVTVPGAGSYFDDHPSWSPDGTHLVISRLRPQAADVAVALSAASNSIAVGGSTTLMAAVSNRGPDTAPEITAIITAPTGLTLTPTGDCPGSATRLTCSIGALAPGESTPLPLIATGASDATPGTTYQPSVSVSASAPDPDPSNNDAQTTITVSSPTSFSSAPPRPRVPFAAPTAPPIRTIVRDSVRGLPGQSPSDKTPQLWVVQADTGAGAPLPPPPADCAGPGCRVAGRTPVWSPDGLRIAYDAGGQILLAALADTNGDGRPDLPLATTTLSPVTGFQRDGLTPLPNRSAISAAHDPAWAPDGSQIVFAGQPAGQPDQSGIYALHPDGTGLRTIAQQAGPETEPAVQQNADVGVTLSAVPPAILLNAATTLSATVTNAGPSRAAAVTLTLTIPAGLTVSSVSPPCTLAASTITCPLGVLASGARQTITVTAVGSAAGAQAVTAMVSSPTPDPDVANNAATATVTVTVRADVGVTLTAAPPVIRLNATTTLTATVTNTGPSRAESLTLTMTIPAGLVVSVVPAPCTLAGATISCPLGALAAAAQRTIAVTARGSAIGAHAVTATVSSPTPDPVLANNTATVAVTVVAQPRADVAVTVRLSESIGFVGGPLTATIGVVNRGPSPAAAVRLTVTSEGRLTVRSASASCVRTATACALGTLAVNGHATVTATLVPGAAGLATVTGKVASTTIDPVPVNNTETVILPVKQPRIRLLPPIGAPGFVTLAFGEDFPPATSVRLTWQPGINTNPNPVRVDPDGTLRFPLLIVRHDRLGKRLLLALSTTGRFSHVTTTMLVVPGTEGPPRFVGRK
ncbi:MAG: hypothetical protein DLM58_20820 [Pseudonocardiales bacterium]|nr:MAG: hypothetical protein DLM58_20820 [Pseudonocardiales bacterium]